MENRGDGTTPLWLTEFAWGSGPESCINKGSTGQRNRLISSFRMFLRDRKTWNVQRLFWFLWRDPTGSSATYCSFCGTAGLLRHDRSRKPAFYAFKGFTAETTASGEHHLRARPGSFIRSDPDLLLASNEAGSTFVCRYDSAPFVACASPYTRAAALPERRPHLLRERDRRPRQCERGSFAVVHRRHRSPSDHDHRRAVGHDHRRHPHLHLLLQ
jgi:hypothetical protein